MKTKTIQFSLYFILMSLILFSCDTSKKGEQSSENETTEQAVEEVPEEAEADLDNSAGSSSSESGLLENRADGIATRLSGVYVTSIKMPHMRHQYNHLFDNDESTYWATMQGAGPDEGIMIYFEEPIDLSKMYLHQFEGEDYATVQEISLYANGKSIGNRNTSYGEIEINENDVSSLYIRLYMINHTERKSDQNYVVHQIFDPKKSAAISQVELYSDEKRLQLKPPKLVKGKLTASSTLKPKEAYGTHNLMDSRKELAWVEGGTGLGIGETITAEFDSHQVIRGVKINNGFQRSEKHFLANARLKTAVFQDEQGTETKVEINDVMGVQRIAFDQPLEGKKITMTIEEGYKGTAYEDLVISEMKFFDEDQDIIIADKTVESLKKDLEQKANGTVLSAILDRNIVNKQEEVEGFTNSFILRSDYTFVAYLRSYGESEESEKIADGNWEIKEMGEDMVKIRVFGKLANVSTTFDYYAGNSEDSYLQIFQDFVTIEKDKLSGEKFIDGFKILLNE